MEFLFGRAGSETEQNIPMEHASTSDYITKQSMTVKAQAD